MGDVQLNATHVAEALDYAHQVVAGGVPACKWVKAACQRQLDDLERERSDPDWPYFFDAEAAERICRFIELLPHVKGKWGGQMIRLEAWQKFCLCCMFGWRRVADGLRRFRTAYEEVPRKNAKTTVLAGIGLFMLVADGEWGAEVYSAATTRDQSKIVFDIASQMARMSGDFRARFGLEALTHSMIVRDTASKMLPLSAEAQTLDGLNVSCALIDELHAHKTRLVHDVLDSATGARSQALIVKITTSGSDRAGVCYDQRSYLTKVLNTTLKRHGGMGYPVVGEAVEDETFWGIIYTVDGQFKGGKWEGDDPFDEATWRKANPNYGISVDPDDMRRQAALARVQASALNGFLTKRLDVWVNADSAWMNMMQWDGCADPALKEDDFRGEECLVGLDAAFKKDLFAKVKLFRRGEHYYAFGRYYTNEALASRTGNEQLGAWVREGWIRATPGEVLDIAAVREELLGDPARGIEGDAQRYSVREVAFDPAQLTQFAGEMMAEGLTMVELRPSVLNFSPAMKELEELVAGRRFHHNGDPVLAWAVANVICHRDAKDNIYPRKQHAEQKIDPAIALLMALARSMHIEPEGGTPAGYTVRVV